MAQYVDKQPKTAKKGKKATNQKLVKNAQKEEREIKQEVVIKDKEKDKKQSAESQGESAFSQMSLFSEKPQVNYKKAKAQFKSFLSTCVDVYEEYKNISERVAFDKKEMLSKTNAYLQALIVSEELSNESASENNLQFALEIAFFENIFDKANSLDALKAYAKTKLFEVPSIFMLSVIIDSKNNSSKTAKLYSLMKKSYLEIYKDGDSDFMEKTKNLVNFLIKQGIKV